LRACRIKIKTLRSWGCQASLLAHPAGSCNNHSLTATKYRQPFSSEKGFLFLVEQIACEFAHNKKQKYLA
jgi:hypothetical protein